MSPCAHYGMRRWHVCLRANCPQLWHHGVLQVRGLVFINPGNPTGQCLSRDNLEDLIKFAYDERVALMCDPAALHLHLSHDHDHGSRSRVQGRFLTEPACAQVR